MSKVAHCHLRPRCGVRARRLSTVGAVVVLVVVGSSVPARGQDDAVQGESRDRFFLGGAFLVSSTLGATEDPAGYGFLRPYFHGSVESAAVGAVLNGGFFVERQGRWSVGAEIALRRAQSATVSEETRSKFEFWRLSALYTERERLVSVVARLDAVRRARVTLQPMGGLTVSQSTKALTNRHGWYEYPGGQLPIERPDRQVDANRVGFLGGADLLFHLGREASITCGVRAHWVPRGEPPSSSSGHEMPSTGPLVLQISAGVRWSPSR